MEEDTLSLDNLPLCFDARFWLGSGIMLLGLTEEGEVRSSARAGGAAPSLGVHALPLAMRANREFASSAVMAGLPPARDDPNPNHPIVSAEHDADVNLGLRGFRFGCAGCQ